LRLQVEFKVELRLVKFERFERSWAVKEAFVKVEVKFAEELKVEEKLRRLDRMEKVELIWRSHGLAVFAPQSRTD
jgi:hypothetical protein